jgi:hypothetical protein
MWIPPPSKEIEDNSIEFFVQRHYREWRRKPYLFYNIASESQTLSKLGLVGHDVHVHGACGKKEFPCIQFICLRILQFIITQRDILVGAIFFTFV